MAEQMKQNKAGEMTAKQAIPVGYKQTEVGVIPEDWDVKRISDIADVFSGGTPNRENPKYWDGNVPWITTTLIDGKDIIEANEFITEAGVVGSSVKWCRPGAILMAMYGQGKTRGKVAILSFNATINQACAAIELKDLTSSVFVLHMLTHMYKIIRELSNAGGQENLSGFIIKNIRVPYPPKQERIAIANSLSDTDALISGLEQLIAKKQAIKSATMQQLLTGRTRLPQFALRHDGTPKGYKSSELGQIPEDWEVVCFDQLKDKKDNWAITGGPFGSNLKASDYTENGVRVIQLQNIGDGIFKNDDFVYTSYKKANEIISCNIYPDEIILSKMGDPVARACLIPHFHSRYVMCSDGIRLKVDNQSYSEKFVFYFLNYRLFRNQALDASTGSTRKRIGLSELRELLLFAPTKEEQTAIATILSDMDSELTALEQKLTKACDVKQGMMQQLLTGRIRLPLSQEA